MAKRKKCHATEREIVLTRGWPPLYTKTPSGRKAGPYKRKTWQWEWIGILGTPTIWFVCLFHELCRLPWVALTMMGQFRATVVTLLKIWVPLYVDQYRCRVHKELLRELTNMYCIWKNKGWKIKKAHQLHLFHHGASIWSLQGPVTGHKDGPIWKNT